MTRLKAVGSKTKEKQPLLPIICKGCKVKFTPKDHRQRYHSDYCRTEHYSQTYFRKTTVHKTCPNCGTIFPTTSPKKRKFCNDECRDEYYKKRRDELDKVISSERAKFYGDRFKTLQDSSFRCSYCGKDAADSVKLDVEPRGDGAYRTICSECAVGREYTNKE